MRFAIIIGGIDDDYKCGGFLLNKNFRAALQASLKLEKNQYKEGFKREEQYNNFCNTVFGAGC